MLKNALVPWLSLFSSTGVITPAVLLTSPCQQSLIDQCGRLITGFTPQKYLSGLVPDSAIKDDCEAFASVRLCNDKVLKPCMAAELVTLDPFIRQANEFIMLFCENDQFRRDYAHHGQCLAVVSTDINQCIASYGSTVSDIAAMSESLAPQEVLHRSCCDGLHRLTQCSYESANRKCHPSSADFVKKFLYKMMKSTLQDWIARQCFEYQSQCEESLNRPNFHMIINTTHPDPKPSDNIIDASTTTQAPPPPSMVEVRPNTKSDPILFTGLAATGTRSSVGRSAVASVGAPGNGNEYSAMGTETVLTQSVPDVNASASGTSQLHRTKNITADDAVVLSAASRVLPVVFPMGDPASSTETAAGNAQLPPKTFSIKTFASEKSRSRIRNIAEDTHPLARKFLLIISTIAFLAGWF